MMKRITTLLGSVALLGGLPVSALAQSSTDSVLTEGPYVGIAGGASIPLDINFNQTNDLTGNHGTYGEAGFDVGPAAFAQIGYGYGNGLRTEFEAGWLRNDASSIKGGGSADGHIQIYSLMLNALYDFDLGGPLVPHIGAGLGLGHVTVRNIGSFGGNVVSGHDNAVGYQAIVGADYALTPDLKLDLDYRFFGADTGGYSTTPAGGKSTASFQTNVLTVGLRWEFDHPAPAPQLAPPPPPVQPPAPPPAPHVEAARSFQVFFDFDKSNITSAAAKVIQAASDAVKAGHVVQITVTGHTDTVGSAAYNQGLSERRATAVKDQLVADGVSSGEITTIGVGKTGLLVPTADGVREPQNRRAEIVLQ